MVAAAFAFFAAIIVRMFFQGWVGLVLALSGAVLAPALLLLMHGGRGIGMGDLKLAAASIQSCDCLQCFLVIIPFFYLI